jgi:hypothetical protein
VGTRLGLLNRRDQWRPESDFHSEHQEPATPNTDFDKIPKNFDARSERACSEFLEELRNRTFATRTQLGVNTPSSAALGFLPQIAKT